MDMRETAWTEATVQAVLPQYWTPVEAWLPILQENGYVKKPDGIHYHPLDCQVLH